MYYVGSHAYVHTCVYVHMCVPYDFTLRICLFFFFAFFVYWSRPRCAGVIPDSVLREPSWWGLGGDPLEVVGIEPGKEEPGPRMRFGVLLRVLCVGPLLWSWDSSGTFEDCCCFWRLKVVVAVAGIGANQKPPISRD